MDIKDLQEYSRHDSTVVVFDQRSHSLSLRHVSQSDALQHTSCPTCHRPYLEDVSPHTRNEPPPQHDENHWMDPHYFRMLPHAPATSPEPPQPPSPRRRIAQPSRQPSESQLQPPDGTEFIGSEPRSPPRASGISSAAFTQGYFKSFFVDEGELGRGGKGVVLLVKHVLDGVSLGQFACKRVPVGDDHTWLEKVLVEVQLLQNLSHQNLVSYRHVWLEDCQITNFGPSVPCAFILQQYCNGGDLHNYVLGQGRARVSKEQMKERMRRRSKGQPEPPQDLQSPRRMVFDEIFSFFKDITSGLHHLHSHGYIHRDLKPNNCLLHDDGQRFRVLVSDFGEVQMENMTRKSTGATGTISYCAPEVLMKDPQGGFGNFTTKSDVFSLGMIVYFMCFGKLPYSNADGINEENEDLDQLRAEISTWAGFDDERRIRGDLPDKLYKFLKRLLSLHANDRPSTEEILQGIKAGTTLEELDQHEGRPSILSDLRHRISSLDTPVPTPPRRLSTQSHPNLKVPPSQLKRPQSSPLRQMSPEQSPKRNPSPVKRGQNGPIIDEQAVYEEPEEIEQQPFSSTKKRLALPPPPRRYSRIQDLVNRPDTVIAIKTFVFLLKIYTLSRSCSPYESNWYIAYPLIALALLDFVGISSRQDLSSQTAFRRTSALLAFHLLVVFVASRTNVLCAFGGWHQD
jgi:serine/threonine protein kinase